MIVGVTIDPRAYTERLGVIGESRMCRVFGYRSTGMPSWAGRTGDRRVPDLRADIPGIVPALVFQDWPSDDEARRRVDALLDEIDAPCRLTWRHEADRKREDSVLYRRRYFLLADWVAAHTNGVHVTLVPTSTYQWTMMRSPGKGQGDWSKYHTGVGQTGIDVYADSWRGGYPDPAQFLAPLWRYRDTIGAPLEFPEFGAARVAADDSGERRAEWLVACADIMAAEGVTAVAYWDDIGSNGTDLRLWRDDPETPETVAWREVARRHLPA